MVANKYRQYHFHYFVVKVSVIAVLQKYHCCSITIASNTDINKPLCLCNLPGAAVVTIYL